MYFIVGANGQLGRELANLLTEREIPFIAATSSELDITDFTEVSRVLKDAKPSAIFDAAAYTKVDLAEDEGKQQNWLVNAEGTKNLAVVADELQIPVVYVSTDYVFSGTKNEGYTEEDLTSPINEYGRSKLEGEQFILQSKANYVVRTSWVYGQFGNNFVKTMKKLAQTKDTLSVVNDQFGRPTWTKTLAEFMIYLLTNDVATGIYNLSNSGEKTTWYGFASEILKNEQVKLVPVNSEEFKTKAARPHNSLFDLGKAESTGYEILDWKVALSEYMKLTEIEQ